MSRSYFMVSDLLGSAMSSLYFMVKNERWSILSSVNKCEDELIRRSRAWDKEKNLSPQQDSNL